MRTKVKKTDAEWKEELTPEQYEVTRKRGTEPAFTGKYYGCTDAGIYKCVCCGNSLFNSGDKYESGSGWPSFTQPLDSRRVRTDVDFSHGMTRTEVVCDNCDAHLGHVFDDGPDPTGMRYCMYFMAGFADISMCLLL